MRFEYDALDSKGEQLKGTDSASSEAEMITILRTKGLYPTRIKQIKDEPAPRKKRESVSTNVAEEPEPENFTMTITQLLYTFGAALIAMFGGAFITQATDYSFLGIVMVIIGFLIGAASAILLINEHNRTTKPPRRY